MLHLRGAIKFFSKKAILGKNEAKIRTATYELNKRTFYTPNLLIHKMTFKKVGKFNEYLRYGVDTDWSRRAEKRGIKIIYCEKLKIYHWIEKSYLGIIKTWFWYGFGRGYRELKYSRRLNIKEIFLKNSLFRLSEGVMYNIHVLMYYCTYSSGILYFLLCNAFNKKNIT